MQAELTENGREGKIRQSPEFNSDFIVGEVNEMELTTTFKKSARESTAATAVRYALYTLCVLILAASLPWVAQYKDAAAFKENGAIEWLQFGILASISLIFLREAHIARRFQQTFILLACLSGFAAAREMDANLDLVVPWLGWKIGYLLVLYAAYTAYSRRKALGRQIASCMNTRAFLLLWAGFVIAIPFAQLIGNSAFLKAIMTDDYSRDYSRMIEEVGELMGYYLLLIGSYELILQKRINLGSAELAANL